MEKKATRAAAITKVATRAKPAQAAVRTATAVKEVQAVNRPAANTKAAAQKELLEKAKGLIKTDRGIKTLPGVIGHTGGRGVRPGLAEFDPGSVKGPGGRITPPHINPDILNPYLTASGSILPVSPKVISFVYSLDGQAKKANSPKDYDEQWKGCVFDSWHTGTGPIKINSPSFFEKDILEQPERRFGAVRFKENVSDEEKLKKLLETPASELKNLREILNKNTRLKK